jgi:hypothetical protein
MRSSTHANCLAILPCNAAAKQLHGSKPCMGRITFTCCCHGYSISSRMLLACHISVKTMRIAACRSSCCCQVRYKRLSCC